MSTTKKLFTNSLLFLFLLCVFSCEKRIESNHDEPNTIEKSETKKISFEDLEILDIDSALFNGKIKRFFPLKDFEKYFGKPDSIVSVDTIGVCSFVFMGDNGYKNPNDKMLYKNGSEFEMSDGEVAISKFRFNDNNYIKYNNIILNSTTTVDELSKLFPNAISKIYILDVYNEGKLQVFDLREGDYPDSDGDHMKFFLRNGKLSFMYWWSPC
ncbi:hypothetical protein [Chishuiella sp.]|uniref:hypothetical protein n=1 Tax=Chishuiella sp. TaxID=1969467 RepID=UPI0028B0C836|nr:hypothetical protein [Chishuiella sp.]